MGEVRSERLGLTEQQQPGLQLDMLFYGRHGARGGVSLSGPYLVHVWIKHFGC